MLLMKEIMETLLALTRMMQEKDGVMNKFIFGEGLMMSLLLVEKVLKIQVKECSHFLRRKYSRMFVKVRMF